jgi:geranylgeranyl diphosphate synthase, type I
MSNKKIIGEMRSGTTNEIQKIVQGLNSPESKEYFKMVQYHLGISDCKKNNNFGGKMIRPLILLLCSNQPGSLNSWKKAFPAAAAVELLHNFSLIHDDIQDNSPLRRNRETVWKIWGIPQAINTGDGLFAMANISIGNLEKNYSSDTVVKVMRIFNQTCLDLTRGQYLDISFEQKPQVSLNEYWKMIENKTANLISASASIGAVLAGFSPEVLPDFIKFGYNLGLAFQINDDILGIWGNEDVTGKSNTKDLEEGKKTLPIIYELQKNKKFTESWKKGKISRTDAIQLAEQLKSDGVLNYAQQQAALLTYTALKSLDGLPISNPYKEELFYLTTSLLNRET